MLLAGPPTSFGLVEEMRPFCIVIILEHVYSTRVVPHVVRQEEEDAAI